MLVQNVVQNAVLAWPYTAKWQQACVLVTEGWKARLCAYPRLVHRLLQRGEFSHEVDAELPLHVLLNVSGTHLALDMLPSDAAQVHLECIGFAAAGP